MPIFEEEIVARHGPSITSKSRETKSLLMSSKMRECGSYDGLTGQFRHLGTVISAYKHGRPTTNNQVIGPVVYGCVSGSINRALSNTLNDEEASRRTWENVWFWYPARSMP